MHCKSYLRNPLGLNNSLPYFLNCHSVIPAADLSEQVRNESSYSSLFP